MLHRRKTGEIVGAGERVAHPYSYGEIIISSWERVPRPKKRKRDPQEYEITVYAYRSVDGLNYVGYDGYAPHELGLVWRDDDDATAKRNST